MNIFDAHVSGSLSVSGSGEISNDLLISGNLTVLGLISGSISGSITNANTASEAPKYTLTSSFNDFTASHNTGSFTGSFIGDGSDLYNIPASGVTGLELNKVTDGAVNATISAASGFKINTDTEITGTLKVTGNIVGAADFTSLRNLPTLVSGSDQLTSSLDSHYVISGSITQTTWDNIASKPNGIVSGSVQVELTGTTGYSTFSSSVSSSIGSLSSSVDVTTSGLSSSIATTTSGLSSSIGGLSSSIATTDFNQNNRLGNVEVATSSLNSFTSSINTTIKEKLNNDGVLSGSITFDISTIPGFSGLTETVSGSISSSVNQLSGSLTVTVTNLSSSLTNTDESQNARIVNLETASGSLNSFTSSINTTIKNKLNNDGVISGSVQVELTGTTGYSTFSSSVSTTTSNLSSSIGGLSSSIATTDFNQDSRLTSIENKTGSYATTGSNVFVGDQSITGSLVVTQNLQVLGSSSFLYVTSSQLNVSSSTISVNVFEPAERFGGLKIYDSGSSTATASLLWDSLNNRFIYQNVDGAGYHGAMFIAGPRNSGSLGDESALTSGKIPKSVGGDHIDNSIMSEISGNTIAISGSLVITGSILSTTTPIVSGSSQIDHNSTTNYVANQHIDHTTVSITAGDGISGGGTIASTRTITLDTGSAHFNGGVKTKLNAEGVISGSSQILAGTTIHSGSFFNGITVVSGSGQISFTGIIDKPSLVSGSGQISFTGITDKPALVSGSGQISFTNITDKPTGLVSGSSQVLSGTGIWSGSAQLPSGTVSGSSQISLTSTTGYVANEHIDHTTVSITAGLGMSGGGTIASTRTLHLDTGSAHLQNGIKSYLNTQSVVSSSVQITYSGLTGIPSGIVSGSSQVAFGSISGVPSGLVSGSSQITYGNISGIPSGIVSGSSQISYGSITGIPSGIVSGSSQVLSGTGIWSGSAQLPSGVVSGSSQVTGIGNSQLTNSSFYIGGTSISLGRSSASQTLSGVSIDGNAATATSASTATTLVSNATVSRDLYVSGNASGNYANRILIGTTTATYVLQDTNLRPTFYMTGAYPVITLNQTATNTNHGATIQFASNGNTTGGSTSRQIVIGANGNTDWLDVGFSGGAWGDNTNYNPHNGIAGYSGALSARFFSNGLLVNANNTAYGSIPSSLSYNLDVRGSAGVSSSLYVGTTLTIGGKTTVGTFPNSTTNTGEAWFGRASDRNQGTYTIQLGGNSASSRSFEVVDYAWSTVLFSVGSNGNTQISGTFTENSSLRYKKDIETVKYGLDKVLQMRGVMYVKKDTGLKEIGVIAEEMNEIVPEVIMKNEEGEVDSVSYSRLSAVFIEAIKELKQEINEQNLIITELKRKLGL